MSTGEDCRMNKIMILKRRKRGGVISAELDWIGLACIRGVPPLPQRRAER